MAEGRFYLAVLALSSLGAVCVLFTIYWMWSWHGGFAWDGSTLTFNCHPVLMVAGMVVVYSAGEWEASGGGVRGPGLGGAEQPLRGAGGLACLWAQVSFGGSSSEGGRGAVERAGSGCQALRHVVCVAATRLCV